MHDISTRVQVPRARASWVIRARLCDALSTATENPLTLLVAAAGYGKSSLIAQYAAQNAEHDLAYVSLSPRERDLPAFAELLAAALARAGAPFHPSAAATPDELADELFGVLAARERETRVVLDGYQLVESSEPVNACVEALARDMPAQARLIVSSRSQPKLRLGALTHDASVIGEDELRLTPDELRELLARHFRKPPQEIDGALVVQFLAETEGWLIAARARLQLMSLSGAVLRADQLQDLLNEYFAAEVLTTIEPSLLEFLLKTSLLDSVSPRFCEENLNWRDVRTMSAEAERQHLFIHHATTGEAGAREYTAPFRRFLRENCQRTRPSDCARWHAQLSHAYEGVRRHDLAIEHALAAGDTARARAQLAQHGIELVNAGHVGRMLDWLAQCRGPASPSAETAPSTLTALEALCHVRLGQFDRARARLAAIEAQPPSAAGPAAGDIEAIAAILDNATGQHAAAAQRAQHLSEATDANPRLKAEGEISAAESCIEMGRLAEALTTLARAKAGLVEAGALVTSLYGRAVLAEAKCLNAQGRTGHALRATADAVTLARTLRDDDLLAAAMATQIALVAETDLALADVTLAKAVELAAHTDDLAVRIEVERLRAEVAALAGRLEDAVAAGRAAVKLAETPAVEGAAAATCSHQICALAVCAHALCLRATKQAVSHRALEDLSEAKLLAQEALASGRGCSALADRIAHKVAGEIFALFDEVDTAKSLLQHADDARGEFHDALAGGVLGWILAVESEADARPDALPRAQAALERIATLRQLRGNTAFVRREGDVVWARYVRLSGDSPAARTPAPGIAVLRETPGRAASAAYEVASNGSAGEAQRWAASVGGSASAALRVFGFGTGRAYLNGEQITIAQWGWNIPRELLIYILTVREATRERIGSIFWPTASTATMQRGFHNAKFTIRNVIGAQPMLYGNGVYTVNPDLEYWYDVQEFEQLLELASEAPPADALESRVRACGLYADDFLIGSDLEWAEVTRQRLRAKYIKASVDIGEAALKLDVADARLLDIVAHTFQTETLREDVARTLMKLHWQFGRRNDALEVYLRLRTALEHEIGVKPEAETEALIEMIRSDRKQGMAALGGG